MLSGTLTGLVFFALLAGYVQTLRWQYLALAGIVAGILGMHGIASWLARGRGRFDRGIWLIAAAQIWGSVLAPLFMADYWLIGLFLLAVVPIEVGIADRPSRMPLVAVFTLLGAASMVGVDLLELPARLAGLSDLPGAVSLVLALLITQVGGLGFLLWHLRLRPGASHRTRLNLTTQLSLVFTVISALSILVVTGVLTEQLRSSQIRQVGRDFQTWAEINAERVGNGLENQINALASLSRQEMILVEGLTQANARYPETEAEVQRILEEREQRWQTAAENSDFVLSHRSNPQTLALSRFRGGNTFHSNIFLTDRQGGLVAAQGDKPPRFFYGDEPWWQSAWHHGQGGTYLGRLEIDPETKSASIFIAVGVINPQTNQTIGVLASTYDLRAIQRDIGVARPYATGEVNLIGPDGVVIAGPEEQSIGQPAWPSLLGSGILAANLDGRTGQGNSLPGGSPALAESGWLLGQDRAGNAAVLAHAPLNTTSQVNLDPLRALGWQVVVNDTQANALAEVTRSTRVASLVGLLVMALVVLLATATARVITRPIEALTTTAAAISEGNLEQRAPPVGPVELVTLAEAFNTLTARLRLLINNLQEQVAQRTEQLEAQVEQLATLNRITQTVTSVHDLKAALEIVAREMVHLFDVPSCGIALLDSRRTELTVVASYARNVAAPSAVGTVIPISGNPSSAQVIDSGNSIVLPQAQTNPLTAPIHDLMRARGTQCLMLVPLLARGEVIGTIGVVSDQTDRVFSPAEVRLAETIAGQIAGAIENARLFTQMEGAKEAAEAANQAKSAFLANVSHELRTPLTSVLGFARIIQKRLEERVFPYVQFEDGKTERAMRQVSDNINIIISEGERLTTLINDVLDLAKIEAGKVEWHMQPLSVAEVIERAIAATSALFEHRGLGLVKDINGELPAIVGDRDRLIQAVINLLSNAVKFTEQGSVTCRARFQPVGPDSYSGDGPIAHRGSGEIVVSVIDTGVGIAEADQRRVFETFAQAGDMLTGKPMGTGLGLSICKEIIEHHGGRIWLESEVGRGSIFSFALPVAGESD
ncbi:MAG: hypothetical protein Kow0063_17870 [Anaerolineae bacterium]